MSDNKNFSGGDAWNAGPNTNWTGDTHANNENWNDDHTTSVGFHDGFDSGNAGGVDDTNFQDAGAGGACRNCGQEGHFARECTEPRKMGPCFNCGEEGHSKSECTKPRVFKGTCNICSQEGHPAARCPAKPKICARCKVEGDHDTKDCKNNFYIDLSDIVDMSEGAAWAKMVDASLSKDLDDFKEALRILQKAAPELTYSGIEKKLRAQHLHFYLIALEKDVGEGYTLVDLQGEPDKTYCVAIYQSPDCKRPNMVNKWPASPEENLTRLTDAGIPLERGLPYCRNCSSFGHVSRDCDQDKVTVEGPTIQCALCGEVGHRVRDCTEPRKKPREGGRECRICGSTEHIAKECDQKPVMKCRNCDQEGHKASECTEPRKIKCSNCDEEGHLRKECPKPIDWEKVTCRHCGEKGHMSATRCAPGAAKKRDEDLEHKDVAQETNGTADGGWDSGNNVKDTSANGDWNTSADSQAPVAAGGW